MFDIPSRVSHTPLSSSSLVPRAQPVVAVEEIYVPLKSGGGHLKFGLLCNFFFIRMGCSGLTVWNPCHQRTERALVELEDSDSNEAIKQIMSFTQKTTEV